VKIIKNGINYAKKDRLVTFGVSPTKPETGYGYIKSAMPFKTEQIEGINIDKFIEKPDIDNARKFLEDKRFVWNSGIFAFKATILINEIKKFSKNIFETCNTALLNAENDLDFKRIKKEDFAKCQDISLDVAVMEKTNLGTVLNLDVGWSDIGNWNSLWEISKKDINGNSFEGKTYLKNVKNCFLRSESRLVVGVDLNDLVIIETRDAILVANKKSSQKIKQVVNDLSNKNFPESKQTKKTYRPWGNYISLVENNTWQVKRIEIKPGESISLQKHNKRSEHWVVVKGIANVEIDNKSTTININESIFVSKGTKHRLANHGDENLIIVEVQIGDYLGEDDIIRFDDLYGRK
jgi:mannose-1-phosphate guanylyltransferase